MANQEKHNRHHLLYYRRDWIQSELSLKLRNLFIYDVPVNIHSEYHKRFGGIPVPNDKAIERALKRYDEAGIVEYYNIVEACDWLISNVYDKKFIRAMRKQRKFFAKFYCR